MTPVAIYLTHKPDGYHAHSDNGNLFSRTQGDFVTRLARQHEVPGVWALTWARKARQTGKVVVGYSRVPYDETEAEEDARIEREHVAIEGRKGLFL
jgi:hypothetical protein